LTAGPDAARYVIEPFDPDKHDRTAFSCGVEQVDNYFKKTANKLHKAGNVRLYVMRIAEGAIIGFYAINAHAVDYTDLPKKYARTRPGHGSIPAAYISMIGRDERFRGGGFGGDLLIDALLKIAQAADHLGIAMVMLDVLDCGDAERTEKRKILYEGYGFRAMVAEPLRMFLPMGTVRMVVDGELGGFSAAIIGS